MPIEFNCGTCNSLLRTADDTVGKGARCPNCGNIQIVPEFSSALPIDVPAPTVQAVPADDQSRHGARYPAKQMGSQSLNPYAASAHAIPVLQSVSAGVGFDQAKSKIIAPAILMIILNSIGIAFCGLATLGGIIEVANNGAKGDDTIAFVFFGIILSLQMFSVFGSVMMLRMSHYKISIAAVITSMVAGFVCCFIPSGFAIWALVVLLDPNVSRYFR